MIFSDTGFLLKYTDQLKRQQNYTNFSVSILALDLTTLNRY